MRGIGRGLKQALQGIADTLGVHPLLVAFVFIAAILWGDYLLFGRHNGQSRVGHVKTPREAGGYTLFLGSILLMLYLIGG